MSKPLDPGDEIRCLHCGRWHPVHQQPTTSATPYAVAMLFWTCRGREYYAGQIGYESRHPTRRRLALPDTSEKAR